MALVVLVVFIVRKVDQAEWDSSLTKKKLATVIVGLFSIEKRRLETSRERPKSATYLRLKNSKKTSKCQVLSSTVPEWGKKFPIFFEIFLSFW